MKLKLFDKGHAHSSDPFRYEIKAVNPLELLESGKDCVTIERFSFDAFCKNNSHIQKGFANSSDKAKFQQLFSDQIKDGLQEIITANQARPDSGFVIVARAMDVENKPIVGFLMGVRNGVHLPSQSLNNEIFGSDCGLRDAIMSAFGPVISAFDMSKMSKHDKLFMLGLTAVDNLHTKKHVATGMFNCLSETLERANYEGAFSIATSEGAYALRDRMKDCKVFLETDSICFAGVAFGDSNLLEAFKDIDINCRVTTSETPSVGSPK